MGVFDSLSSLLGNPQAAAGAVAGPPQPTPTLQQQPGMSPMQLAMMRDYIKQLQKHNLEPVGPTGGMGQALAANAAKALASGITGYQVYQAGQNELQGLRQDAENAIPNFGVPGSPSPGSPPVGGGGGGTRTSADATAPVGDTPLDRALNHTAVNETGNTWSKESAGKDSPDAFHSRSYGSLGLNTHYGSVPEGWHDWDPYKKMAYEKQYFGKIYNDVPGQLQQGGFSADIASNPGVKAYMADRAIQMGNTGQIGAYNAARGAATPQEFMDRVTKYDKATLPQHFHTALSERPNIYQGLQNRVDKRHAFATAEAGGGAPSAAPTAVASSPIAPVAGANTAPPVPTGPAPAAPSPFMGQTQEMAKAVAGPQGMPPVSFGDRFGGDPKNMVSALSGAAGPGGAISPAELARGISPTGAMVPPATPEAKQTANAIAPGTVPTPAGEAPLTNPQLTGGGPQASPELSQPGGMVLDKPIIPPEAVPRRPMYTRQQMVDIMASPRIDPAMKQQYYQSFLQQNQEIPVPYKGMGTVYVSPTTGAQRWVPDPIKSERKIGGITRQIVQFYNPRTNQLEEVGNAAPGTGTGDGRPVNTDQQMMNDDIEFKRREEEAKKIGEITTKPIGEAIDAGTKSQEVINVLDRMNDAYKSGGVPGGPAGTYVLKLKQLVNEFLPGTIPEKEVAAAEIVRKSTAELALKAIKEASSRGGTQREFIAMLDNNPGIELSNTGAQYMINILTQQEKQKQAIGRIAATSKTAEDFYDRQQAYYANPKNALISPLTGKPLLGANVKEDVERLKAEPRINSDQGNTNTAGRPSPEAVAAEMKRRGLAH